MASDAYHAFGACDLKAMIGARASTAKTALHIKYVSSLITAQTYTCKKHIFLCFVCFSHAPPSPSSNTTWATATAQSAAHIYHAATLTLRMSTYVGEVSREVGGQLGVETHAHRLRCCRRRAHGRASAESGHHGHEGIGPRQQAKEGK